jgi:hypothetical protein
MADLITIRNFFDNADAHSAFLHRVAAAIIESALAIRGEEEPDPMTQLFVDRQLWAVSALQAPVSTARLMLPALAVKANDAGLLSDAGEISATDAQIRSAAAGLVNACCSYVPSLA